MISEILKIANDIINYLLANWIAIIALVISYMTFKRNSIFLDVDIEPEAHWIYGILLDDGSSVTNEEFGLVHFNIRIINTSNFDIGYFDLRVMNEDTHEQYNCYNNFHFSTLNGLNNTKAEAIFAADNKSLSVELPTGNTGIVKAHSLNLIDIVFSPEIPPEKIFIMFKTTKKKSRFKKYKHGYINTPYQQYSQRVILEQASKPDYEKFFSD